MLDKFNIIEVTEDGKRVYLDTEYNSEYVESVDVREIIYKNVKVYSDRPLTHEEAVSIVEDLYESLQTMHNLLPQQFKDFKILEVIELNRMHRFNRLATVGIRCDVNGEADTIWITPVERAEYPENRLYLTGLNNYSKVEEILSKDLNKSMTFERFVDFIEDEFDDFIIM